MLHHMLFDCSKKILKSDRPKVSLSRPNMTHIAKWNESSAMGSFYECVITESHGNGTTSVHYHDNDRATKANHWIFTGPWEVEIGDACFAYLNGHVQQTSTGKVIGWDENN